MNENKDNKNAEEISKTTNTKEENSTLPVGIKRIRKIAIFSEYEQEKPSEQENSSQTTTENATKRERKKVKHFDEKEETQQESLHLSQGTPSPLLKISPSNKSKKNKQQTNFQTTTSISSSPIITSSSPSIQSISSTSLSFLETLTSTNPEQIEEASLCKVLSEQKRELEEKLRAINSDLEKISSKLKEKETSTTQPKTRKKITIKMNDSPPKERAASDIMIFSNDVSPVTPNKPLTTKTKKNKSSKKKTTNKQVEVTSTITPSKPQRSKRKQEGEVETAANLSPVLIECQKILNSLIRHKYSFPFLTPVDPVALNIPDYFKIIKYPMDLGTIKKKLLVGSYLSGEEFSKDVFLVFDNACTYNHPGSDVYVMSETLRDLFVRKQPSIKKQILVDNNNNNVNNLNEINNQTIQKSVNNNTNISEDIKIKDSKKSNNNNNTITTNNAVNNNENFIAKTDNQKENNIIIIKKKPAKVTEEVEWTREDKLRLGANIGKLSEKNLRDVFQIIKNSTYVDANEKEVVFDLDALEPRTLRELDQYISKVNSKKKSTKKSTRNQLIPSSSSSTSSASNLTSFTPQNAVVTSHSSSLPTSPILSPNNNLNVISNDQNDLSLPSSQSEEEKKSSSILPEDIPMILKPAAHTKIEIENVSWMSLGSEKDNVEEIRTSSESLWSEFQNKDFLNKQKEKERRDREERLKKEREEKEEERKREEQRLLQEKENEQIRLELEKEEARKRVEKELEELRQKEIEERERAKQKTSMEEEEEDIEQFVGSMEFSNLNGLQSISFNRSN